MRWWAAEMPDYVIAGAAGGLILGALFWFYMEVTR